jgi:hypothetical protein
MAATAKIVRCVVYITKTFEHLPYGPCSTISEEPLSTPAPGEVKDATSTDASRIVFPIKRVDGIRPERDTGSECWFSVPVKEPLISSLTKKEQSDSEETQLQGWIEWLAYCELKYVHLQDVVVDYFNLPYSRANFDTAFRDLNQLTTNFQELPFEKIEAIVSGEAKRAAEKLDVLGVKFPLSALRTWGAAIVLLMSTLFLIHISALAQELKCGKVAAVGAWMGLYSTLASRVISLASITLLPLATALFIAKPFAIEEQEITAKFFTWAALSLLLVSCGMSARHLIFIWRRYRFR